MIAACNNINNLNQRDLQQFEGTICNALNGINNKFYRKTFNEDQSLHSFTAIAVHVTHKMQML